MLPLLAAAALAEPSELVVWHSYRGQEREALEGLLEAYGEAHRDLQLVPLAVPYDSYVTKLEASIPRGNGPDLFIMAHERVGAWSAGGLVSPIDASSDDWHPVTVDALSYDGRLYGVPMAFKCLALFYNKALLDRPPTTSDELLELGREHTGDGTFGLVYEAATPYHNAPWMHGLGGGFMTADGIVTLDAAGNAAGLAFARQLTVEGIVPEDPTGALVSQLFNEGKAAMVVNGPWFVGEVDAAVDYAIAPLPTMSATGLPAEPFLTVDGAMVSGHANHPEQAEALALWLAETDQARVRAVDGRQPVATLSAYLDPAVSGDPILGAFRRQLDHSRPLPNRPEMEATWEPMARSVRRALRGAVDPETAVAQAQTEYEVVSRPAPPRADWRPYAALLGLLLLGGLSWVGRSALQQKKQIRAWSFAYGYVAPAATAMTLLVIVPFVVGAGVSLFAHRGGEFTFVGLANFLDIIFARDWPLSSALSFWYTLVVTVVWTVANVVLHVGIGVALAMLLREPWLKLRGIYRMLLILPWAVPNYITALIWKGMFHKQFGAVNGLLVALGADPVSWFGSWATAFAANVTTNTWLGFPFMMVVTLGALQAIPRDLEQAAEVDGATGWQRFRHVTLPLLKPALLPAVILGSVWTFNMFNIIFLVSGGEPDGGTEILISEAYKWAFTRGHRYGYASAYAVLIFFVLLFYSRFANRIMGRKVL